jgi:hypothetical protein
MQTRSHASAASAIANQKPNATHEVPDTEDQFRPVAMRTGAPFTVIEVLPLNVKPRARCGTEMTA